MSKRVRVTVTGAAGQIGYALLFRMASGQIFGPQTEIDLQLLEREEALPALEGVAMELDDCAFPLLRDLICTSDLKRGFLGSDWCVLVGAVPRQKGMERKDLLHINAGIFAAQGMAIDAHAGDRAKVFVVGNPCNTNCLITMKSAPRLPRQHFFAMTMLDENRAKIQLAKKANVPVTKVEGPIIWGNHSTTQYPDFDHATIDGRLATEVIGDRSWFEHDFIKTIQQRGAAILEARGASSAASAANAIAESITHLTQDTQEGRAYSMAVPSGGEYGIEEGLVFSYPCRTRKGSLEVIEGVEHGPFAAEKIRLTHEELKTEREAIKRV